MADLPDTSTNGIPPLINIPPLPALTTLVVGLHVYTPSPRLTNILCSIDSAPALSSVAIEYSLKRVRRLCPRALWADVDRWLSRISKQTKVTEGLSLTLRRWPEGRSVWEGFLPEFRESGGPTNQGRKRCVAKLIIRNFEILSLKGPRCFVHPLPPQL